MEVGIGCILTDRLIRVIVVCDQVVAASVIKSIISNCSEQFLINDIRMVIDEAGLLDGA